MLIRRKKKTIEELKSISKPPKAVPILFSQNTLNSPFILDLPEKLNPLPITPPAWQPTTLDRLLTQPIGKAKRTKETLSNFDWSEQLKRISQWRPNVSMPKLPAISLPRLDFLNPWQKAIAGFVLIGLILVLPLPALSTYAKLKNSQTKITGLAQQAFGQLQAGQQSLFAKNLLQASLDLQSALDLFARTQQEINEIPPVLRVLLSLSPGTAGQYLNGERLMMAGANLAMATLPLAQVLDLSTNVPLTTKLDEIQNLLTQVLPRFQAVKKNLAQVSVENLPPNYQTDFSSLKEKVDWLTNDLEKIQPLLPFLSSLLGGQETKRYLLIFQNDNELRPTGGFIGSFALVDFEKGKMKTVDFPGGGPYDLQGSLKAAVLPPAPIQLLKARWEFQDANWFPDFPASAKKIAWFYEKSGGPTVDGVIALDTHLFKDLLKITGEISLPEYKLAVNDQNFNEVVQKQVEIDYDKKENQPKKVLADLAPKIISQISSQPENLPALASLLLENLAERHLQLFLFNPEMENLTRAQGWGGEIKDNPEGDFLMVVNTNIAGGKTDGVIKQTIQHQAKIEIDGSVVDTVTITRGHQGQEGDLFTNLQNVDYLRLYAPAGSELLKAEGFTYPEENLFKVAEKWYKLDEDLKNIERGQTIDEHSGTVITQEFSKTSFGNWVLTKPGQTSTVSFSYKLPFKLRQEKSASWFERFKNLLNGGQNLYPYSLLVQKQAGRNADSFASAISFPPTWQKVWQDPTDFNTDLSVDRSFGIIFSNKN